MKVLLEKIERIIEEFESKCEKTIFEEETVAERLTELIKNFELEPEVWRKYVHYDSEKYTRNLIANGKDDRFGLMILAWGPGHKSPIHDHNGSHCIMRVLEGGLLETLYKNNSSDGMESDSSFEEGIYEKKRETVLSINQTAYINDKIGWHRVSNASSLQPAVSLHLYAPPIETCRTFCEVEGKIRAKASCPYYSINGIKISRN